MYTYIYIYIYIYIRSPASRASASTLRRPSRHPAPSRPPALQCLLDLTHRHVCPSKAGTCNGADLPLHSCRLRKRELAGLGGGECSSCPVACVGLGVLLCEHVIVKYHVSVTRTNNNTTNNDNNSNNNKHNHNDD